MLSQFSKRDIRTLYTPPAPESNSSNFKRLSIVIVLSMLFVITELIAGTISHSISIVSDAIHLICDVLGYFFSFLFLYLANKAATLKMTFGWHRMELLGALANIFIVWTLILFLMYESAHRIINKEFVQKPLVMLIAAAADLVVNVAIYKVLHGGAGGHSHGLLGPKCNHDHKKEGHCQGHSHSHHHDHHEHKLQNSSTKFTSNQTEDDCKHKDPKSSQLDRTASSKVVVCSPQQIQDENDLHLQNQQPHHHHHSSDQHSQHSDNTDPLEQSLITDMHSDDGHNHEEGGIGMQAAVLHALSDMIMSVGLIISSLVIFFLGNPGAYTDDVVEWNPWHLFDPIATYIFSITALISTLPVIKNSYLLLMDSAPASLNLQHLRKEFLAQQGVLKIQCMQVWELKPGKTVLAAHAVAKKGRRTLALMGLSDVARVMKIYHTTFQVREEHESLVATKKRK